MNALLQFHRIAAQRGDGLLPGFAAVLEQQPVETPDADLYLRVQFDDALTGQSEQISDPVSARESRR